MVNMKKLSKIASIVMVIAILLLTISPLVMAAPDPGTISEVSTDTSKVQSIGGQIIAIIGTIGSIASIIVLIVLGLKYMMGSPEEKAEYKKTLLPYVIGAVLVFAASAIAAAIFGFANQIK